MNAIAAALRASFAAQETLRGETVCYRRDALDCTLTVVRGQTQTLSEDLEGARFAATTVDWHIDPDLLRIAGQRIEPAIGDVLTDAAGRRYTTAHIAGEKVWRNMDHDGVRIRVHTVEIE
jgi:hypothetical protein